MGVQRLSVLGPGVANVVAGIVDAADEVTAAVEAGGTLAEDVPGPGPVHRLVVGVQPRADSLEPTSLVFGDGPVGFG